MEKSLHPTGPNCFFQRRMCVLYSCTCVCVCVCHACPYIL